MQSLTKDILTGSSIGAIWRRLHEKLCQSCWTLMSGVKENVKVRIVVWDLEVGGFLANDFASR